MLTYIHVYSYRQNPTVKRSVDEQGKVTTINTQRATKVLTQLVTSDVASIPTKPRENCPDEDKLEKILQDTIAEVRSLFTHQKPAWTRRALRNSLKNPAHRTQLRHAIPYVGYVFRSGPWRDAIIRFGYDPRTTPESRAYQTLMFKLLPREPEVSRDGGGGRRNVLPRSDAAIFHDPDAGADSHLFTGHLPLARDGKMWMLCDITDPELSRVLFPEKYNNNNNNNNNFLRPACEIYSDGWYDLATLSKVRTVMRAKIQLMLEDKAPNNSDDFAPILSLPDHVDFSDPDLTAFSLDSTTSTPRQLQLATELRAAIRGSATWREVVGPNRGKGKEKEVNTGGGGVAGNSRNRRSRSSIGTEEDGLEEDGLEKRVQSNVDESEVDVDDDVESEGEEEAIERADMLEAQVTAAQQLVQQDVDEQR